MIPDSLDFILRPTNDEQAEYAAAHKLPAAPSPAAGRISEEAVRKGSQAVSSGPTPASPTVPLGEAGPHSSDADAVGAPASGGPRWAPVDDETADLLTLVANTESALPEPDQQWDHFVSVLRRVANANHGLINQNAVRPLLRGEIKPQRIGAFYNRAAKAGLIRASQDHTISNDKHGRNTGKPARLWEWMGAAS